MILPRSFQNSSGLKAEILKRSVINSAVKTVAIASLPRVFLFMSFATIARSDPFCLREVETESSAYHGVPFRLLLL